MRSLLVLALGGAPVVACTKANRDTAGKDDTSADVDSGPGDTGADTGDTADSDWGQEALAQVQARAGTYEGAWEMWGLDANDQAASAFTWTDVAVATDPTLDAELGRAYLTVTDTMFMSTGDQYTQTWTEGVLVNEDGSTGQIFVDSGGTLTLYDEVEEGRFEARGAVSNQDLRMMENVTADNLVSGTHLTTKLVSWPDGIETHDVSRLTTVTYSNGDGPEITVEFTSFAGRHQKTSD